jgi:hypothetical protein
MDRLSSLFIKINEIIRTSLHQARSSTTDSSKQLISKHKLPNIANTPDRNGSLTAAREEYLSHQNSPRHKRMLIFLMIRQCIIRESGDVYIGKEGLRHDVGVVDDRVQGAIEEEDAETV